MLEKNILVRREEMKKGTCTVIFEGYAYKIFEEYYMKKLSEKKER